MDANDAFMRNEARAYIHPKPLEILISSESEATRTVEDACPYNTFIKAKRYTIKFFVKIGDMCFRPKNLRF